MTGPLSGWARGNLILLFMSFLTTIQFVNSMALVLGPSWYWNDVPLGRRRLMFLMALVHFVSWMASFFGESIRTRRSNGGSWTDSNQEIIFSYILILKLPQAFLSLGTLVFAVIRGELKQNGHEGEHIENDHPGDHGPAVPDTQ